MIIDISTKIGTTSNQGGFKGLLDVYSGAAAAYSLRKLSKATTSVVRVRRDSDNAEADFTALEITDGTLAAFCTGTDGLVTTWYDQSGNGNDATQSTAASQPKIVSAGVLVTENGKPAVDFDGGDDYLLNTTFTIDTSGGFTLFFLEKENSIAGANNGTFNVGTVGTDGLSAFYNFNPAYTPITVAVRSSANKYRPTGSISRDTNQKLLAFIFDGIDQSLETSFNFSINSSLIDAVDANSISPITSNEFRIGRAGAIFTGEYFIGKKQEFIIYPSDQSTNRSGIEANINKAFNIYWDGTQKGLLDTYTGAEAAYSLRALNSAYTGAIIKVRRASDNAEQDIYAKWDGTLNVEALETFCAATDGYVVTWYDQSGNANNATQATAASQPQIVSSGSIITDSGYEVIQYDGSDDNLGTSFTATGTMLMGGSDGGAFYPVAISGAYNLLADVSFTDHPLKESIRVIWGRTLSAGEQSAIESRVTYSDWDFSDVTDFFRYWRDRTEITQLPLLDVSNGTQFFQAWYGCTSLTSFPALDVSSGTIFAQTWRGCNSLTSFPLLDVSSGTNFAFAWNGCSSLTSFPALDLSNSTNFIISWSDCPSLQDFPANMFDSCTATNFTNAFTSTNLTQTSIDNILVSIDTAGQSNGTFDQSGGSAPSAVGEAAIDNLRARGWTVSVTGGY